MTFREWLLETKLRARGPVSDFAHDVQADPAAVTVGNIHAEWLEHLRMVPGEVLAAFARAWAAYERAKKREAVTIHRA